MDTNTSEEPPLKRHRQETVDIEAPSSSEANNKGLAAAKSDPEVDSSSSPLEIFSPRIFEKSDEYAIAYNKAKPYPHGVLKDLFVQGYAGK
jgi:hypothetical protein